MGQGEALSERTMDLIKLAEGLENEATDLATMAKIHSQRRDSFRKSAEEASKVEQHLLRKSFAARRAAKHLRDFAG